MTGNEHNSSSYLSASQRARVLTEGWAHSNLSCPACGSKLDRTANNTRARDFICSECLGPYELKAKASKITNLVPDGAYESMLAAIRANQQPSLFLLRYGLPFAVKDVFVLPRRFLIEEMLIKRKPLSTTARRAGWIGCNLNLKIIPVSALIPCVINGSAIPQAQIQRDWHASASFESLGGRAKSWAALTLAIVERLPRRRFTIDEIYMHEGLVQTVFPRNQHVRAKLRQQLQVLRDFGVVTFLGAGNYELITPEN